MRIGSFGQVVLVVAGLGGCAGPNDGRFVGHAVTTQGDCGLGFVAGRSTATLLLRSGAAEFVPSDGVTVLPGRVDDAGQVRTGSAAAGAEKKPFVQAFEGKRDGDRVSGQYATPRCRATVELMRG